MAPSSKKDKAAKATTNPVDVQMQRVITEAQEAEEVRPNIQAFVDYVVAMGGPEIEPEHAQIVIGGYKYFQKSDAALNYRAQVAQSREEEKAQREAAREAKRKEREQAKAEEQAAKAKKASSTKVTKGKASTKTAAAASAPAKKTATAKATPKKAAPAKKKSTARKAAF